MSCVQNGTVFLPNRLYGVARGTLTWPTSAITAKISKTPSLPKMGVLYATRSTPRKKDCKLTSTCTIGARTLGRKTLAYSFLHLNRPAHCEHRRHVASFHPTPDKRANQKLESQCSPSQPTRPLTSPGIPQNSLPQRPRNYRIFAYSAFAAASTGRSASASFHSARKS